MKRCCKCKETKDYSNFYKTKTRKDGYDVTCKDCVKIWKSKNKEHLKNYLKKWNLKNKERASQNKKRWHNENKNKHVESIYKWRDINKEHLRKYWNEKTKKRLKEDNLFYLKSRTSILIYQSLKNNGYSKKTRAYKILGCSFEEFKTYIEIQFTKGMTWENKGKWHLDHIIPISSAKTEEEVIRLNHYTNFQPLWVKDNLSKSNKIIEIQLKLI